MWTHRNRRFAQQFFDADDGNPPGGGGNTPPETPSENPPAKVEFTPEQNQFVNDLVAKTRKDAEEKTALRLRAEADAKAQSEQDQRDRDAATARGDFDKVKNDLEAEVEKLKADLAQRELNDLKRKVGKHKDFNLPDALIDRLKGTTEDELRADAKELAAHIAQRNGPDTDSGKGGSTGHKAQKKSSVLETFEFGKRG